MSHVLLVERAALNSINAALHKIQSLGISLLRIVGVVGFGHGCFNNAVAVAAGGRRKKELDMGRTWEYTVIP